MGLSDPKTRGKDTALALQMSALPGKPSPTWGCQGLSAELVPERERQQVVGLASLATDTDLGVGTRES